MRGRKPDPTALKILKGNPGHRPLETLTEPEPVPGLGETPQSILADPIALATWQTLGAQLVKMGTMGECDAHAFASYCQAVSEMENASAQINRLQSLKRPRAKDTMLLNTYIGMRRNARKELARYGPEFGIGAASRTRIKLQPNDGQSELPLGEGANITPFQRVQNLNAG